MEGNHVASFRICLTVPVCLEFHIIPRWLCYKSMCIILDKDFLTYCLLETRSLVYQMKTFSGTPTEAVY